MQWHAPDLHNLLNQKTYHQDPMSTWHRLAQSTIAGETAGSFVPLAKSSQFPGAPSAPLHCDSGRSPSLPKGTTMRIGIAHKDIEMHAKFQLASSVAAFFFNKDYNGGSFRFFQTWATS